MDWYTYIEAYHRGLLGEAQKLAFEQAMVEDADLREAVEQFGLLEPTLDLLLEEDIRVQLDTIRGQSANEAPPAASTRVRPIVKHWRPWAAAASIAILALYFVSTQDSYTVEEGKALVFEYRQPTVPRGEAELIDNKKLADHYYFEVHRFIYINQPDSALQVLLEMENLEDQNEGEVEYYRAVAHYIKGDFAEAKSNLSPLLADANNDFYSMARKFAKVLRHTKKD